ncbi:restriction endonuclease subunit S [Chlorogloea sp. CCALA 695]|uniref:restriction endonuclease subunit S n=1 Tax=Chlorogloea sp. CCALA 695 TaxID=2107693 RepID=UPI0011B29D06|nr:restriction endonuclease subunit S [Chlorogloea sp. CCALA 695]
MSVHYPLQKLGSLVIQEPAYGATSRAIPRINQNQPRYIRITDFDDDGIETGHEFLTADPVDLDHKLIEYDLLFARSGATVGKTYLHEDTSEPAIFAGYCIRFRLNKYNVLPRFVYFFTKTDVYARWIAAIQRPSGQPNINKEEFKNLQIPVPPIATQTELVAAMDEARSQRKQKLSQADALLSSLDSYLLNTLGLDRPAKDNRKVFSIQCSGINGRFDPHFHAPSFKQVSRLLSTTITASLGSLVSFSKETWKLEDDESSTFRYIEISNVKPETGEARWSEVPVKEAPSRARMVVRTDDIIVSLTRPHHGSIAYLSAEFDGCIASTGFAVIRYVSKLVDRDYLWCVLRSQICLQQMLQRSSGGNYPAIIKSELENVIVPVPGMAVQKAVVTEVQNRRNEARRLRSQAEAGWQEAKRWFEEQLLGSAPL